MIKDKYPNSYFELLAALNLISVLNYKKEMFVKCEPPDWIYDKNIGIEVTKAIDNGKAKRLKLINSFYGKGLCAKKVKDQIEKYKEKDRKTTTANIDICNGMATNFYVNDYSSDIKIIEKIIDKKIKIYEDRKKDFKKLILYVFSFNSLIEEKDIDAIKNRINNNVFDEILIDCRDNLFVLFNEAKYNLSDEVLSKNNKVALENHTRINNGDSLQEIDAL